MATETGEHYPSHARLEDALSFGHRFVQLSTIFQLVLVGGGLAQGGAGGFAAAGAQSVQFISNPGRAANGQGSFIVGRSHALNITDLSASAIEKESYSRIGVCLTNQGGIGSRF